MYVEKKSGNFVQGKKGEIRENAKKLIVGKAIKGRNS